MSCVNYNIIKEGDLINIPEGGIAALSDEQLHSLYDGNITTISATVSGSPASVGIRAEYGEYYDICYVNYYTNESNIDNINIFYGVSLDYLDAAALSLESPGLYRGTVGTHAAYIEIRHTVSGTGADIYQIEVIAVKNESLGFGASKAGEIEYALLKHATVDTLSAGVNRIPIFNNNNIDDIARIAVAPTFTKADDYIHLSTSLSGTYYGINDFGVSQPGPNHIPLVSDSMNSTTEIHPQWEVRSPSQAHIITPTADGLLFDLVYGISTGSTSGQTTGIFSRGFFTATSFTAEIEIRFLETRNPSVAKDLFFILTNGYPNPDVGYKQAYSSDGRRGLSTGGVAMKPSGINIVPSTETLTVMFRYADGLDSENPVDGNIENRFTGGVGEGILGGHAGGPFDQLGNFTLEDLWDIINAGQTLSDLTESASWHKWKISYDHTRQELSGWVDNIFLGSRVFKLDVFREACRIFIGHHGQGGFRWQLRNFKFIPDVVAAQKQHSIISGISSIVATVSGTIDNVNKLVDENTSTAYVGPNPNTLTKIRISLDSPSDVTYYSIKQRSQSTGTSAFGKTYFPDVARVVIVNWGNKYVETNVFPNSNSRVLRAPTFSGTAVIASGIEFVEWQFVDYDRTSQPNGALVIEDLTVYSETSLNSLIPLPENKDNIPWVEGVWKNVKQYGGSSLALRDKVSPEAAYWPFPEYLSHNFDYGFSSAVNGAEFALPEHYHHSESLFSSPKTSPFSYSQWHSDVQVPPEPFYIWRYLDTAAPVAAVYFDSDTLRPSNVADSFKFQYLLDGGNPNVDDDWVNIPPITKPYTHLIKASDILYKRYKDYLIANTDGEYYTNYFNIPNDSEGSVTFFSVGATGTNAISFSYLPAGFQGSISVLRNAGPANGLSAYVEFDDPIVTRGIRLVVNNPTIESGKESGSGSSTPGLSRNDFALSNFGIVRTFGAGVYTSPVFDTGTNLNTERLNVVSRTPEGTSISLFARSSSQQPEQAYDIEYETWRGLGWLGNKDFSPPSQPGIWNRAVVFNGKIYYTFSSSPFVYDPRLDLWSQENGGYPSGAVLGEASFEDDGIGSVISPNVIPDDRVEDNTYLLGGVIYVAAYNTGQTRIPRLIKLDLNSTSPVWKTISENRPPSSEFATMVGYQDKLYFFNQNGTVIYYDIFAANWVEISNTFPNFGSNRRRMTAVVYKDRFYIFGGADSGKNKVTIFDPNSEIFYDGEPSPKEMVSHQAVLIEELGVVYVLPVDDSGLAAMKYYIEEDRWLFLEAMMWDRDKQGDWGSGSFYFRYENYIYRIGDQDRGQSRALVLGPAWQHGKFPERKDLVWGSSSVSQIPWRKLNSFGELLPQERYFQFKIELYSEDRLNSPVLDSVRVVNSQSLPVPASGTGVAYIKIGVSEDKTFHALYTGDGRPVPPVNAGAGVYSILSTYSSDGLSWGHAVTASGVSTNGVNDFGVGSPWVVTNDLTDYQVWYVRSAQGTFPPAPDIRYVQTSDIDDLTQNPSIVVLSPGVVAGTGDGVLYPCVLKESSSSYKMWFTGRSSAGNMSIYHATSNDGITWTSVQKVIDYNQDAINNYDYLGVFRSSVLYIDSIYKMWYTATDDNNINRIFYRESFDGIMWGLPQINVNIGSAGIRDERGASKPCVFFDSGTYYIYYFGLRAGVEQCLRATSSDGITWDNFLPAFPTGGLAGIDDGDGIVDVFVSSRSDTVIPGEVITTGKIKLHNEGTSV